MDFSYLPLAQRAISPHAKLADVVQAGGRRVTLDSPAVSVLTDFTRTPAACTGPETSLAEANRAMIARGVRTLLVVDGDRRVLGIVTATDLLGERPMTVARERAIPRTAVQVRDVMTPSERVVVIPYAALAEARVGHVVATLVSAQRQHALAVEGSGPNESVRGVFSLSQIANDVGVAIELPGRAATFAEIEKALAPR
jgi:CBS domain-containing protein